MLVMGMMNSWRAGWHGSQDKAYLCAPVAVAKTREEKLYNNYTF